MKHIFFILFCILTISNKLFSQHGTLKIAKPTAKISTNKDTVPKQKNLILIVEAGSNYTFKGNSKVGYFTGVILKPNFYRSYSHPHSFIGIQFSTENQYYKLSAFNTHTMHSDVRYDKSENQSEYLKFPLGLRIDFPIGPWLYPFSLGLTPEYLIKSIDKNKRLNYDDFNQFNLAGNISFGIAINRKLRLNFTYSKDFFENLKDRTIYNSSGVVIGSQKSKTNLVSFSLSYRIYRKLR